jgi:hypothetical protein
MVDAIVFPPSNMKFSKNTFINQVIKKRPKYYLGLFLMTQKLLKLFHVKIDFGIADLGC